MISEYLEVISCNIFSGYAEYGMEWNIYYIGSDSHTSIPDTADIRVLLAPDKLLSALDRTLQLRER